MWNKIFQFYDDLPPSNRFGLIMIASIACTLLIVTIF